MCDILTQENFIAKKNLKKRQNLWNIW